MMKKMPQWLKVLGTIVLIDLSLIGGIGAYHYMKEKRKEALYQHAFRLLEQQTAYYLKEHYSGISKIEFSPIFVDDSTIGEEMQTVIPVIYDEHGNRALLGTKVGKFWPEEYGHPGKIDFYQVDKNGRDFIEMRTPNSDYEDLSDYENLPEKAKYKENEDIDENIDLLVEDKQLEAVKKNNLGSPNAKIKYNFKIVEGDYSKWR